MSIIKPSSEDRIKYTFTKIQRADFIEQIKDLGIPTVVWDEMGLIHEQYSKEHLLDWMVRNIQILQEKVKKLEENTLKTEEK